MIAQKLSLNFLALHTRMCKTQEPLISWQVYDFFFYISSEIRQLFHMTLTELFSKLKMMNSRMIISMLQYLGNFKVTNLKINDNALEL